MRTVFAVSIVLASSALVGAAGPAPPRLDEAPVFLQAQFRQASFVPQGLAKAPGLYTRDDWREIIDELWGEGLPTATKLHIFDALWDEIDTDFACFQDLKTDWDQIRARYRPEIEDGVSRGRFAAILNHMLLATRESHTTINDPLVNFNTALVPGVPMMWIGSAFSEDHFGACLTPLPDRSLLVYDVKLGHPLGLQRGDRILGYEGIPWHALARELLRMELPAAGSWGSSDNSFEHTLLQGAGRNWHLFDNIDVVKYDSGQTLSLPTMPLTQGVSRVTCTEQIEPAGVERPRVSQGQLFSWGVIEGTRVGYIYGFGWFWDAEQEFRDAVARLMFHEQTIGMIIDFRTNFGGNMFLSNPALSLLFDEPVTTIAFSARSDPNDRLAMEVAAEAGIYVIPGDAATSYNRPIAVLTGPNAVSSGDQVAYRMTFHPHARTFGKTTATAFNAPTEPKLLEHYGYRVAVFDAFDVTDADEYLTHDEFVVDQPVWLEPADAANGVDTVVKEAVLWIQRRAGAGPPSGSLSE